MKLIELTKKGHYTKVSDEDYEWLNMYNWYLIDNHKGHQYTETQKYTNGKQTMHKMHRLIMNVTDPKVYIDHKDGDGLNNQRENLRVATHGQNCANRNSTKNSISRYLGVFWIVTRRGDKEWGTWRAACKSNGRKYGYDYKTEQEAAIGYNELAKIHHGEFARLNTLTHEDQIIYEDIQTANKLLEELLKTHKRCGRCFRYREFKYFGSNTGAKDGRLYCCNECRREYSKDNYNPEKERLRKRRKS